jgi:hypothetical protein
VKLAWDALGEIRILAQTFELRKGFFGLFTEEIALPLVILSLCHLIPIARETDGNGLAGQELARHNRSQ